MSILNSFYTIEHTTDNGNGSYNIRIRLNPDHEIFKGHFPGNPVTPGVCMMQIVKDLTEQISSKKLFLTSASNVKFMAIINPEQQPLLDLNLEIAETDEEIKVKNTTLFGETIALKMSVNYKILNQ